MHCTFQKLSICPFLDLSVVLEVLGGSDLRGRLFVIFEDHSSEKIEITRGAQLSTPYDLLPQTNSIVYVSEY